MYAAVLLAFSPGAVRAVTHRARDLASSRAAGVADKGADLANSQQTGLQAAHGLHGRRRVDLPVMRRCTLAVARTRPGIVSGTRTTCAARGGRRRCAHACELVMRARAARAALGVAEVKLAAARFSRAADRRSRAYVLV